VVDIYIYYKYSKSFLNILKKILTNVIIK